MEIMYTGWGHGVHLKCVQRRSVCHRFFYSPALYSRILVIFPASIAYQDLPGSELFCLESRCGSGFDYWYRTKIVVRQLQEIMKHLYLNVSFNLYG